MVNPQTSRKVREFERRGQDILDAALELFESDDWEHVTVDEIAKRAEVAKGTIYKHFASKNEIYARLAVGFQRHLLAQLHAVNPSLQTLDRFREFTRCAWTVHLSSKALHRVFLYCTRIEFRTGLSASLLKDMQATETANAELLHQLVVAGIKDGLFPEKPIEHILFGARSAFWGAIQLVWSGYTGDVDKDQYLKALTDFMLAGMMSQDRPLTNVKARRPSK